MHTNLSDQITDSCVCCHKKDLQRSPAIIMPFVSSRALGWAPVTIDESWGMRDVKAGTSYAIAMSLQCNFCHHLFLDFRFSDTQMARLYRGYEDHEYELERQAFEPQYKVNKSTLPNLLDSRETFISRYVSTLNSILDWGGGDGSKTPFRKSAEVFVFDIGNMDIIPPARKISTKEIVSKKLDLIVLSHVLEHVSYPQKFISNIVENMGPETYLFIEIPFEKVVRDNGINAIKSKNYWHEHINFFSMSSLQEVSSFNFLETVAIREFEYLNDKFVIQALFKKAQHA